MDTQPSCWLLPGQPLPAVVAERAEEGTVEVVAVASGVEVGPDPLGGLRVDGQGVLLGALANNAERVETAVDVQIANAKRRNFGPAQADLEPHRQDGSVAEPGDPRAGFARAG